MTSRGRPVDWAAFPCALGDVVLRASDGQEAWLAGALLLCEDSPAAALFVAPDASGERAVYARARPATELLWLAPLVAGNGLLAGPEPPMTIELEGIVLERTRRLPLRAERVGEDAPDVSGTVLVGEYASAGNDVAVLVVAGAGVRGWRGTRLAEGEYEVWRR